MRRVLVELDGLDIVVSTQPIDEQLGMLEYENLKDDGDIDWAELSRPLFNTAA